MRISPSVVLAAATLFATGMFFQCQFLFILMTAVSLFMAVHVVAELPRSKEYARSLALYLLSAFTLMWAGHLTATYFNLRPLDFLTKFFLEVLS